MRRVAKFFQPLPALLRAGVRMCDRRLHATARIWPKQPDGRHSPSHVSARVARQRKRGRYSTAGPWTQRGNHSRNSDSARTSPGFVSCSISNCVTGGIVCGSGAASGCTDATPELVVPRSIPMMYDKASYSISISAGARTFASWDACSFGRSTFSARQPL